MKCYSDYFSPKDPTEFWRNTAAQEAGDPEESGKIACLDNSWFSFDKSAIRRFDPESGKVTQSIPYPKDDIGVFYGCTADCSGGFLWFTVAGEYGSKLYCCELASGKLTAIAESKRTMEVMIADGFAYYSLYDAYYDSSALMEKTTGTLQRIALDGTGASETVIDDFRAQLGAWTVADGSVYFCTLLKDRYKLGDHAQEGVKYGGFYRFGLRSPEDREELLLDITYSYHTEYKESTSPQWTLINCRSCDHLLLLDSAGLWWKMMPEKENTALFCIKKGTGSVQAVNLGHHVNPGTQ